MSEEMRGLPVEWVNAPIGELCTLNNGRAFKPTEWTTEGLPIVRIQNLNNPEAKFNYFSGDSNERYSLSGGELLFAWSGTPGTSFGAHIWQGGAAVLNQHIFRVDFSQSNLNKTYFRYAINHRLEELIGVAHGGVGLRHVTKGTFENTSIVLPPLDEQKVISDKLDALLAQVDTLKARLDAIPAILKRFRQSVLSAAVTGKLTEEWRSRQVGLEPWKDVALHEVAIDLSYGTAAKSSKGGEVPVLRMGNIQDGKLDWSGLVYTSDKAEIKKFILTSGDVLFNRTNSPELVGKTAVYRGEQPAIYAGYLVKVRCSFLLLPDYLNYSLSSPYGRDWCWEVKTDGVSQSNISAGKLSQYRLELPPLSEQTEIVRRVESLFAFADQIEARAQEATARVKHLTQSILAKAFRGELTEEWCKAHPELVSGLNSAEALLERIRAARAAAPEAKGKRGRKASSESVIK